MLVFWGYREVIFLPSSDVCYWRRNINTAQTQNLCSTAMFCLQDRLVQRWYKVCGSEQPVYGSTEGRLYKMEPRSDTAGVTRTQSKTKHNLPKIKPNQTQTKWSIKWFLMIICYTHRSVPYLVIIREASSGSRWEQMLRPRVRHYVERESKS